MKPAASPPSKGGKQEMGAAPKPKPPPFDKGKQAAMAKALRKGSKTKDALPDDDHDGM